MPRLKAIFAAASAVVALPLISATPAAAVDYPATYGTYNIQNYHSEKCLFAPSAAAESPVVQADCAGYADQRWYLFPGPEPSPLSSDQCLGQRTGQEARLLPCNSHADTQWRFYTINEADPQWKLIQNRATGHCLVPQSTALNAPIMQGICDFSAHDQWWRFT
ncbi:RICIN domain-containing protein [Streptomyces sp. ERV7]|uniref:RICIN domain-containing protein n=1 Tax=Streptomyces sp. ERV7 TaxID=1322334 RepID=UPI00099F53E4|nr:RICIN domain-containing protein [Streptomyces sp. ERV7]